MFKSLLQINNSYIIKYNVVSFHSPDCGIMIKGSKSVVGNQLIKFPSPEKSEKIMESLTQRQKGNGS